MARYIGPDCKICRREGCKLFLKGERCISSKCAMERRPVVPGQHGLARKKEKEYGTQLREKQKVKRAYGLLEKQFRSVYEKAERARGRTGDNLLSLLERRLDNVIYRMGIASSRSEARQIVSHAHMNVNGKAVNIPSYILSKGDEISVKETKKDLDIFKALKDAKPSMPRWLEFDGAKLHGKVVDLPSREDIDLNIQENLIIELYSK
ncbi:MAG: 30S ribosomal protein S4 [Christensenellaceae bacterium]|jgi:small subunit ribosomal protein S4|nr:30S ribosomal protein S4 [Christensenellaceae bacterium]